MHGNVAGTDDGRLPREPYVDAFVITADPPARTRSSLLRARVSDGASGSLRDALNRDTRADHVAIDGFLSSFDLAQPDGYRRFLQVHLAALTVLADRCGPDDRDEVDGWLTSLRLDLGIDEPRSEPAAATGDRLQQAGTAYVLRGSRLGAAVLLKRIADGSPRRYLSHRPALSWSQFLTRLAVLDELADAEGIARAVASARSAFAVFASAARARAAP